MRKLLILFCCAIALASCGEDEKDQRPQAQLNFERQIEMTRDSYTGDENDVARSSVVGQRDSYDKVLYAGEISAWVGTLADVTKASDGAFMVTIDINDHLHLETNMGSDSEAVELTMITSASPFLPLLASTKIGEKVLVWGKALHEKSITENGRMTDPEYVTRFYWIEPISPKAGDEILITKRDDLMRKVKVFYAANGVESGQIAKDAKCLQDVACLAGRLAADAEPVCSMLVEHSAKNDFKWTDGWTRPRYKVRRWHNETHKAIDYAGDEVSFQNGFGAWLRYSYRCTLDVETKNVVDFKMVQGRL